MSMIRNPVCKASIDQVKIPALIGLLNIGEKTNESGEPHHKNQMEIRKITLHAIKPLHAEGNELEKSLVIMFIPCGMTEKLGKEKSDRQFVGMERQ